jgi:branched-subunit amino acid aminotransferase/4-amino-4-deoxychorismate lyase
LASVTESIVVDLAQEQGVAVVDTLATPEDLSGTEVWVLSALHGIRLATEWRDGPDLSDASERAEDWRARYANRRTRL